MDKRKDHRVCGFLMNLSQRIRNDGEENDYGVKMPSVFFLRN